MTPGYVSLAERKRLAEARSDAIQPPVVIKVGLDEWAIINKGGRAELRTDGLSGCVAVALYTSDQAYLAHVFSDAHGKWNKYEPRLEASMRNLAQPIQNVYLIKSDDNDTEIFRNLVRLFRTLGISTTSLHSSGAKIFYRMALQAFFVNSRGLDVEGYIKGYVNTQSVTAREHVYAHGYLSTNGAPAS